MSTEQSQPTVNATVYSYKTPHATRCIREVNPADPDAVRVIENGTLIVRGAQETCVFAAGHWERVVVA